MRQIKRNRVAEHEIENRDGHGGKDGACEDGEMEHVPAVGVAGIAEDEIAVVLDRVKTGVKPLRGIGRKTAEGKINHRQLRQDDHYEDPDGDSP